ncbi:hypothetical protein MPH_06529 [Macrophomina phaseolina MS6]|uniref:Rhodopsin domain-containing protein n=1 Tax=Macrophomina phaseolina (strain MS6) TaxID=1126212 RepID=K2SHF2_MACPH|nr:hypothetical protein MPH_06529 [Macrophomina phaseolina MS6]
MLWDPTITSGSCIDRNAFAIFYATANSVTDLIILFLPIFQFRKVDLPRRQKIGVSAIFMTGGLYDPVNPYQCTITNGTSRVSSISIVRLKLLTVNGIGALRDRTRLQDINMMWLTMELYIGIICACLPHAKPFLQYHFPQTLGSGFHSFPAATNSAGQPNCDRRSTLPSHNGLKEQVNQRVKRCDDEIPLEPMVNSVGDSIDESGQRERSTSSLRTPNQMV